MKQDFSYGPILSKVKKHLAKGYAVGGVVTAEEEGRQRGIGSRGLIKRPNVMDSPEPRRDFLSSFLEGQDQKFKKMKEIKLASSKDSDMLFGPAPSVQKDVNSNSLIELVAGFENFRPTPYDDYKQKSIGFGSKATSTDQKVTPEQAREMLELDLTKARGSVTDLGSKYNYQFTENQILALTSFTHNLGRTNLNRLLDKGNRSVSEISTMMLEYNKAGGEKLPGLVERREAEQKLFKGVQ